MPGSACCAAGFLLGHAAHRLDAERQRQDVEEQHVFVFALAGQEVRVKRRTDGHHLIRVDARERLASKQRRDVTAHEWNARRSAYEDHAVQFFDAQLRIAQGSPADQGRTFHERLDQRVELRPRDAHELRACARNLDLRLDFGRIGQRVLDAARCSEHRAYLRRTAGLSISQIEVVEHSPGQRAVHVVAAQLAVSTRRADLKHAVVENQDRDVEGAATQVVDRKHAVLTAVESIRQRRRRRLVQQAQHGQAREPCCVLGRLPLGIVEVRRHGDHRATDATELGLGVFAQRPQDLGAHLDGVHHASPGDLKLHDRTCIARKAIRAKPARLMGRLRRVP